MSSAAAIMASPVKAPARPEAKARTARGPAVPFGGALQAKLALGNPADLFERQADAAAAHVVGGRAGTPPISALPGGFLAQRKCAACALEDERSKALVQRKCACGAEPGKPCTCHHDHDRLQEDDDRHPEMRVDRKAMPGPDAGGQALRAVEEVVAEPGAPLPAAIRQEMEQGFGQDFSAIRIHDTPRAAASAEGIAAHAYTVGPHIAFNRGRFRPDTDSGKRLLAHELAHTVQQGATRRGPVDTGRISRPGDRHEAEAQHAARAATTGAPMPRLSPGAAPISRYSPEEFAEDLLALGGVVAGGAGAGAISVQIWDTAVAIARAVGGAVSLDGLTIVIDVPRFAPCPEIDFRLQLSDLGLDPTLYFPIAAGVWTVGPLSIFGRLGVEANLDPGIGLRLDGCSFGPSQIRISPFSARTTVMGVFSTGGAIMESFGADLGLNASLTGILTIPAAPPIVLIAPTVGVSLGGTMQLMVQAGGTISGAFRNSFGLGGVSASQMISADLGVALDLAYGLYGSLDIGGLELCRVGWPLDAIHRDTAARITLATALSVGTGGLNFAFSASARPLAANPLADLGFAFDTSRLEDDCYLCELFMNNGLLPGQNGYNWAALEPTLPRLPGPLRGVYQRDPGLASGALCRGTCGVDCPPPPSCTLPHDRVECEDLGDRHIWHTYVNYARCGTHQGCRDHDSCYDFAATMPIWGFGGYLIGPMYRACDLEAMCGYGFQQGVTWATGGGPYDRQLRYADQVFVTPGCYGPCPENIAPEGEAKIMQTCLEDREIWAGMEVGDSWEVDFGATRLYQGFVRVPWIVGVHYGIDASARADAEASATLGPINLENACLIYDPASMSYSGSAELAVYLNGRAGASITGQLDGWLSDFLCVIRALNLSGGLSAGVVVQLPSDLRFGVQLYCARGELEIIPSAEMNFCIDAFADLRAGFSVELLGFTIHENDWELASVQLDKCWNFELTMEPFRMGEMPSLDMLSSGLDVFATIADLFDEAPPRQIDRRPPRNPIPGSGLLFPCLDNEDDDEDEDCPRRATCADGDRLFSPAERAPRYGGVNTLSIPGGDSAGVASWMEAPFLTCSHPPGSETNDSVQRGIYRRIGLPTNSCVGKGFKQSQVFVKGHLLNAGLGGPAEERNLFPITGQANANHKNQVEQRGLRVVPRVNTDQDLIYYKVVVQNISAPAEIMTSAGNSTGLFQIGATFHCEVADYQFCEDDTVKRNPPQSADIRSEFLFHPSGGKPFDSIMRPCSR